MRKTPAATVLSLTVLTLTSTAAADWTWKKADNPSTAGSGGLQVGGMVACKGQVGSHVLLGVVRNGLCEIRESSTSVKRLSAPNYEYLSAGTTARPLVHLAVPGLAGPPRRALREKLGEQGLLLCKTSNNLGWVFFDGVNPGCVTPAGTSSSFTVVNEISDNGFTDLPPLWRDLNTTGGLTGARLYCRASLTPSGTKMAAGVFGTAGGGSCTYIESINASGQPVFARTTDKSRYLVLFSSSNSWEKLEQIAPITEARLRIGLAGDKNAFGCSPAGQPSAAGLHFQGGCYLPPSSGTGAGALQTGASTHLTVLGRWSTDQ